MLLPARFNDVFIKSIVGRMDDNEDLFKRVLDDREFQAAVMEHYLRRVFEQARGADASGGIAS